MKDDEWGDGAPPDEQAAALAHEPPLPDATWAWPVLDIAPTQDETEIRRAYVRRLKAIDPETDAPAFIELREARDLVLYLARRAAFEAARESGANTHNEPAPATSGVEAERADAPQREPAGRPKPEIDPELFGRIERMLFGDEAYDAESLAAAAAALFSHPALDRIVIAESIQNWAVNTIVNAAPRSDPILEPAIARFGWDENLTDWRRPQVLDWILDRRRDAEFERDLIAHDPKYAEVLEVLRTPGTPPPVRPKWRLADGVRALLGYARQHHPTTIGLCDRDVVAGWDNFLRSPPFPYGSIGIVVRNWTGRDNPDRIFAEERVVEPWLFIATLLMPLIFAWALLRPRYPKVIRSIALIWLLLISAAIYFAPSLPDARRAPGSQPTFAASDYSVLDDPEQDINPILARYTGGQLDLAGLRSSNPRLHAQLEDAWQVAKDHGENGRQFSADVTNVLRQFFHDGIRGASPAQQAEYWRLKLAELRWVRQYGTQYCQQFLRDPDYPFRFPTDVLERAAALRTEIWASLNAEPPARRSSVPVPSAVLAAAGQRAHLDPAAFRTAMEGKGPEENICAANIAVAEVALSAPPAESVRLLRNLTLIE